jgi:predicted RNA-binding protein YlxR (DUF448 family)
VVRTPLGEVAIDRSGRAPGRGAYVCDDAVCQQAAVARGAVGRALDARVPAALFGPLPAPGVGPDEMSPDHEGGS